MVVPHTGQLQTAGLQRLGSDPPTDEAAPSLAKVREAGARFRSGKVLEVCNISMELLQAGVEAMNCGLHAFLTAV